ncbi:hypothetical protein RB653_010222 [Dictyostelium firmibasis]|uniref:Uncharacterized protein n=1 Tax=Dictyostelium firmibasis TaxID=79012 RepID=A0AAN7TJR7_9MYCE
MSKQDEKELNKLSTTSIVVVEKLENQVLITFELIKKKYKKELEVLNIENKGKTNEIKINISLKKNNKNLVYEENDKINEIERKISEMEIVIKEIKSRTKKQNSRIRRQDEKIKELNNNTELKNEEVSFLKKQMENILQNSNLKKIKVDDELGIKDIKILEECTIITGYFYLYAIYEYYLRNLLLDDINSIYNKNIDWEIFKNNYEKDTIAIKCAKGIDLNLIKELFQNRNQIVINIIDKENIIKTINQFKRIYNILQNNDQDFKKHRKSLLRICRQITNDEEFSFDF